MHLRSMLHNALLLLCAVGGAAGGQNMTPAQRALFATRADSLAKAFLVESNAPGVSVAIVRGRDTLVMAGFGVADRNEHRPATASTVYRIGSITKQFTAAAIMRLVDQKKLKLDDDVSAYLPEVPMHGHHVKIFQLLNHTSGIHSYTAEPAWRAHWSDDLTPDGIVDIVARDSFDFAPGTGYAYDNTGYVLLGMVLEKVTRRPYAEYLRTEFFNPLGLRQTSYCPSRPSDPSFAAGYTKTPSGVAAAPYLSMTQPFAAGALCSTVRDLVRWQRALDGGRVVSAQAYRAMTTPDTLKDGKRLSYGFGLQPGVLFGHRFVTHDGGINGFLSTAWYFPDDTLSVVVLSNYDGQSPEPLARNLIRMAYGMPPVKDEPPPAVVPLTNADRDRIVGAYDLTLPTGAVLPVHVFVQGGALMMQAKGQSANALSHFGNLVFGVAFDPRVRVTFVPDASGRITKLTLLQNGTLMDGARVP